MTRVKKTGDFAAFLESLEREARVEGAAAIAEMEGLHEYYGFVAALINLRRRRQMTQKDLERETGISQSEISRIESGGANPTLATLRVLIRALGGEIRVVDRRPLVTDVALP